MPRNKPPSSDGRDPPQIAWDWARPCFRSPGWFPSQSVEELSRVALDPGTHGRSLDQQLLYPIRPRNGRPLAHRCHTAPLIAPVPLRRVGKPSGLIPIQPPTPPSSKEPDASSAGWVRCCQPGSRVLAPDNSTRRWKAYWICSLITNLLVRGSSAVLAGKPTLAQNNKEPTDRPGRSAAG